MSSAAPGRAAAGPVGRNDLCPCGSGKKYKRCCGAPGITRQEALPSAPPDFGAARHLAMPRGRKRPGPADQSRQIP